MGLKQYILGTIILIIAVFGYVFSVESGDYTVRVLDYTIILPIALWVVAPVIVLFILSILHMSFYGLKNYFTTKNIKKDSNSILTLINKKLLKEETAKTSANSNSCQFKELSEVLSQLDISISNSDISTSNKDISKTIETILALNSGKYISSKELKLPKENPLMIQNTINRVKSDDNFALEAVKKSSGYAQEIVKVAFDKVLETKSITTVKKHLEEIEFDKNMLIKLFKKDSEQDAQFSMNNETILGLIKKAEFTNDDLITIAKNYKSSMTPDQLIKLFEDITVENEEYTTAYLYVLCEYEMIDKVRDILLNSSTNEYSAFKALIDLKDAGKHTYSIDSLCYK